MKIWGVFNLVAENKTISVPNRIPLEGAEEYLKVIFHAGGDYYIGLCADAVIASFPNADLTDITDEPGSTGTYARKAITRNVASWTVSQVGNSYRARSALQTFTPSGADYDTAITRAFLTTVSSGSSGILLSISGKLTSSVVITPSTPFSFNYDCFIGE